MNHRAPTPAPSALSPAHLLLPSARRPPLRSPLFSSSQHQFLIASGPLPSCLSSWLPAKSQGLAPKGRQFLAALQELLATMSEVSEVASVGAGPGCLEATPLLGLWPAGLPRAWESRLPVVGRQLPRQSQFHFCTL